MSTILAIATMDTKGDELAFLADCLRSSGLCVKTVDVSTRDQPTVIPDVPREHIIGFSPTDLPKDRGQAIARMSDALTRYVVSEYQEGNVAGVIGIGGSGGTAVITAAMRALPVGVPKVMVSTMASGNTAPYVGCCDITMMYSVVDIAGLNRVARTILANGANAIAGMVNGQPISSDTRPAIGMTMFGVTTPCVDAVRQQLEAMGYDGLVFHATGTGGRAMEKLVASQMITGVLDITTTEVADRVVGGIMAADESRFDVLLERRIPLVVSVGAVDMVNFGGIDTVPDVFRDRNLHVHNPHVTLMRTTPLENRQIARWIANKLNRSTSPVRILLPEKGVSMLDAPGQPFFDQEADEALFDELEHSIRQTEDRQITRLPFHINDPEFADELVRAFTCVARNKDSSSQPQDQPKQ